MGVHIGGQVMKKRYEETKNLEVLEPAKDASP